MRVILWLWLACNTGWGAFEADMIDARSWAVGNSALALTRGASSLFSNPAGLADLEKREFYFGYGNQYGLTELSQEALSFGFQAGKFGIGAGISNFGENNFYLEQKVTLAAGRKIHGAAELGIALNYLVLKVGGYERQDAVALDIGLLWQKDKLQLGGVIKNLNEPEIGGDKILRNYNFGVSYSVLPEVRMSAGAYYDADFKEQVQLGQELELSENLTLRAGFQTEPNRYSFGAGFIWQRVTIDYGFVNHPDLGGSHIVGLKLGW